MSNEEGASLRLVIVPPRWRTRWAYFGYVATAVGLLAFGYRYRFAAHSGLEDRPRSRQIETTVLQVEKEGFATHRFAHGNCEAAVPCLGIAHLEALAAPVQGITLKKFHD